VSEVLYWISVDVAEQDDITTNIRHVLYTVMGHREGKGERKEKGNIAK
jgi:hypothetical protein